MRRKAVFLAILSITVISDTIAPQAARAQTHPIPIELHWSAPTDCPAQQQIENQITDLLNNVTVSPTAHSIIARAVVRNRSSVGWDLHLETSRSGVRRQRDFHGERCADVADAASLFLALMVDPAAGAQGVSPPASSSPEPSVATIESSSIPSAITDSQSSSSPIPSPSSSPPPESSSASPAPPRSSLEPQPRAARTRVGWIANAAGTANWGELPGVAAGISASGALDLHWMEFRVAVAYQLPQQRPVIGSLRVSGQFDLLTVALATCAVPFRTSLELGFCASTESGAMSGVAVGIANPSRASVPWLAIGTSALLRRRWLTWFGLALELGVEVPIFRPIFYIETPMRIDVYQSSAVSARGSIAIEFYF